MKFIYLPQIYKDVSEVSFLKGEQVKESEKAVCFKLASGDLQWFPKSAISLDNDGNNYNVARWFKFAFNNNANYEKWANRNLYNI